ncbi:unnamed protein product [Ixodes pacificus]
MGIDRALQGTEVLILPATYLALANKELQVVGARHVRFQIKCTVHARLRKRVYLHQTEEKTSGTGGGCTSQNPWQNVSLGRRWPPGSLPRKTRR